MSSNFTPETGAKYQVLQAHLDALEHGAAGIKGIFDAELHFLTTVKYWYSIPLACALLGLAAVFWSYAESSLGVALCCVGAVSLMFGSYRLNDQRGVARLREVRDIFEQQPKSGVISQPSTVLSER